MVTILGRNIVFIQNSWRNIKSLEFNSLKNLSGYKNREALAEKCKKALEVRFEGEIPMPKNNIKRKIAKKRKSKNYPDILKKILSINW